MGITPNFHDALNTLGVCYTKQEEYEKSIEFYNKALEQQANHPGFILNIAISQFMLGNKGLAKQKYDEAVALAPSFSGKLEDILGAAKASAGTETSSTDMRVIAATHQNLGTLISKSKFRKDLYYRLNVFPIDIAPLRERREDIPVLAEHFLRKGSKEMAVSYKAIEPDALNVLTQFAWPGNIRELENTVKSLMITNVTETITLESLPKNLFKNLSITPLIPKSGEQDDHIAPIATEPKKASTVSGIFGI